MIEVVRGRLDARQRHRWKVALAQRPILVERPPAPARGPQLVAMTSAFVSITMLIVIAADGAWDRGDAALGALAAVGVVVMGRLSVWMWREMHAVWPSGRFLFTWGYVEVEHDRLRYVAGDAIEHSLEGAELSLRAPGWSRTFDVELDELDLDALDRVGAPQPALVVDGYRDAPWIVTGPPVQRSRVPRQARVALWIGFVAILGAAAGSAARTLHDEEPSRSNGAHSGIAPTSRMPSRLPVR